MWFSLDVDDPVCMRTADLRVCRVHGSVMPGVSPCLPSLLTMLSAPAVPESDEAVPPSRGPAVPDQHLPGGWHPHVVPVE